MKRLDRFAGQLYLILLIAEDYPKQEPEYKLAKWYDLFWFLIPVVGFLGFILAIESKKPAIA